MISPQTIEQITNRIDIIDVIGEFVKLKKRGANYLGNCPFHNEKTPSFTVSPSKEIYKCFGCGKSGNTITFLMEHEKYSYAEALKWLAQRYNVEIQETEVSDEARTMQQAAESLHALNNFAQKFFTEQLLHTQEGQSHAMAYLEERGYDEKIIGHFQLGYNPQARNAFATAALKQQFNKEVLLKSGLLVERNDEMLDNYRGRIIFPIHNNTGKIIGFGARVIGKAEKAPKYINTPENEVYIKSKILYGSYFARHSIDKQDECLLVEGYTDVISLHQAGIDNVVASGGTSLTTDQLRIIKKYTANLTIIYDGDAAGIKAAMRGLDMALEEGLNVKLVLIPDKEDPDSYVKKVGADAFKKFIAENKKDFILFQLDVLLKEAGNDITRKNDAVNQVAESLSRLNRAEDFTRRQAYIHECAAALKIDESGLINLVNKFIHDKVAKEEKKQAAPITGLEEKPAEENTNELLFHPDEAQEKNILRVLLEYGLKGWDDNHTVAEHIFKELEQFGFDSPDMVYLYSTYHDYYVQGLQPSAKTLLYHEDERIRNLVVNVTLFPFELSQRWDEKLENMQVSNVDNSLQDVTMSLNYFKLHKIKKMFEQNQHDIEKSANWDETKQLMEVHRYLKGIEREITQQLGAVILK
ncbi:DNA primase [Parafilimonas sp.]|uniref:DNA primase n=1 Tax=Parafilimonas sp. TaxID=1969739 RepID=UPI0039E50983